MPYTSQIQTTLDGGTAYQQTSSVQQTLDSYGNVTQKKVFDYPSASTPIRVYNYTHIADAGQPNAAQYAALYIRDRVVTAKVSDASGANQTTLASNQYDGAPNMCSSAAIGPPNTALAPAQDPTHTSPLRGNLTQQNTPNTASCWKYDNLGNPYWTVGPRNPGTAISTGGAGGNFAAPTQITINNTAQSTSNLTYNASDGADEHAGPE